MVADLLYKALNGIFIEELNGRLCALPDSMPGFDENGPRESRCCESCRRHWERTKVALKAYDDARRDGAS